MAGMRALGRVYNVVPGASGIGLRLRDCSGIGFLAQNSGTAAATLAFTAGTTLAGTYVAATPANGFGNPGTWYQGTASAIAAWTKQSSSWTGGTLTIAGGSSQNYVSYVDFLVSELADTYEYIKVTASGATLTAILYDLTVQRTPENLAIVSS